MYPIRRSSSVPTLGGERNERSRNQSKPFGAYECQSSPSRTLLWAILGRRQRDFRRCLLRIQEVCCRGGRGILQKQPPAARIGTRKVSPEARLIPAGL